MIDDYQESMELMNKMKNCLPIPAYPSKKFVSLLKQRNIELKTNQRLEIIDVHYFGDEGGISCTLKFPFKTEENYVISLTHLRPMSNHPLAKDLRKYQIHRIRNLVQQ
ncbi:hypothetical protein [Nitrosomonas sp. Nm33]|uniref:hypothetical protein n=1 Tax=Nitrosomonas sp. Nm33 TaxID=133724 RepID=UPI000896E3EB|nr:hypothetical protein [Nitrosomonas sp. Nm33]SDY87285.1 hypothetical protein SAMN05421755_10584 [Nitrosomonas sp. Nm33]